MIVRIFVSSLLIATPCLAEPLVPAPFPYVLTTPPLYDTMTMQDYERESRRLELEQRLERDRDSDARMRDTFRTLMQDDREDRRQR